MGANLSKYIGLDSIPKFKNKERLPRILNDGIVRQDDTEIKGNLAYKN